MTPTPSSSGPRPRRGWRARHRAGWTGLAIAFGLAWVFTLWPQLDLATSALFFNARSGFDGDSLGVVYFLYRVIPALGWLLFLSGPISALLRRARPGAVSPRWARRLTALAWVSLLGSGLLINAGLKEHWGRARPVHVAQFGGVKQFSPPLVPTDQCRHNCSFVSGHAATGFVLMSIGLMGSVATRRRWFWIGLGAGAVASLVRISEGGHFLSDTLFAGVAIWASGWLVREAWLRIVAQRRAKAIRGARTAPTP